MNDIIKVEELLSGLQFKTLYLFIVKKNRLILVVLKCTSSRRPKTIVSYIILHFGLV